MRKKLLATALIALSGLTVSAKDVYFFSDNVAESYKKVADVTKITFGEAGMELTGSEGVTSVAFSDFSAFAFTDNRSVGVSAAQIAAKGIKLSADTEGNGAHRSVGGGVGAGIALVEVYSISGTKVADFAPKADEFEFAIGMQGIYVVKVATGSHEQGVYKIVKR